MAEVSIEQLAQQVKATPERLLEQLKQAGVEVSDVNQSISDEEKRQLLLHLRKTHGGSEDADKVRSKITLKRKKISVIKQGKNKVTVAVKSKRTYVKPVAAPVKEDVGPCPEEMIGHGKTRPALPRRVRRQ